MTVPRYWKQATRELAAVDPVLRKLITSSKGLTLRSRGDAFNTLARSIVGQQISVKAAQSVWSKLDAAVPEMHPDVVHVAQSRSRAGRVLDAWSLFALNAKLLDQLRPLRDFRFDVGGKLLGRVACHVGALVRELRLDFG